MSSNRIHEVAMYASASGSSLLLLAMYSTGRVASGLLVLSVAFSAGAVGAMLATYPGHRD